MSSRNRLFKEKLVICVTGAAALLTVLILLFIIGTITIQAIPSINFNYLTQSESATGGYAKAIGNAIVGTILLAGLAVIIGTPLALGCAIYLSKYAKAGIFTSAIRTSIEVLAGTPSVIIGVVGLVVLSFYLRIVTGGWSLMSGAIMLGVLVFPFIERTIHESISTVPEDLEHASYALGGTRWDSISRIVIPYITSGIATGTVLGVGRAAEESAVVLLTVGYSQYFPDFNIGHNSKLLFGIQITPFQEQVGTLPIAIYNSFDYPNIVPLSYGMAAALVLICIVFSINLCARLIISRWKPQPTNADHGDNDFKLMNIFKKKGPGNHGSPLIPHVGIFNRSQSEPNEKRMDSVFSDLQKKPEKSDIKNSIRPYLADPLKEMPSSQESSPALSIPSPTIELLPKEALQSSPDQSVKPAINEDKSPSGILAPPSEKPQLHEDNMPYSVFVVDPVKQTEGEVLEEDSGTSQLSAQAQPSLSTPSMEPMLPASPIQLTSLVNSPAFYSSPTHAEEPVKPTIEIIRETAPSHEVEASAGNSSLRLLIKEDTPMIRSNPDETYVNGLMSKTKDGKPFLDLLHPPSADNTKKAILTSSTPVSQVSDIAMPYAIGSEPNKAPVGLLAPGYKELSPSEDTSIIDSPASDLKTQYNILSEPASMAKTMETSISPMPTPDKINDITHKVKDPVQPKAKSVIDFNLSSIFGGFKKNSKGNKGNDGNGIKAEASAQASPAEDHVKPTLPKSTKMNDPVQPRAKDMNDLALSSILGGFKKNSKGNNGNGSQGGAATQASPTEDEVKSTLQKPAKKNALLGGLNLNFSKPKETVELLDFNVGKLSIPTLDCALKETDVTYEIDPPFQYVHVFFDGEEMSYNVLEPSLSDGEKKYLAIIERALEKLISAKIVAIRPEEREDFLRLRFTDIVKMYGFNLSEAHQDRMFYFIRKNYLGLSKIDVIMKDHYIEDISCNGPNNYLYIYHRVFGSVRTNVSFDELELNKFVMRLAQISGKHISILQPIKDVSMPDGSRANLTMGSEVTKKGATFTIRKFRDKPMSPIELMEYNSIDPLTLAYLWILLDYKKSILVSGGTASGKTTLLNVICSFIRPENKIVSLEDTAELNLVHPNWIQSVTRSGFGAESGSNSVSGVSGVSAKSPGDIGLYDLLVAALRQRPEFIICGEVRGAEAFTMFQAIAVGHACMGTIHAGTMRELLSRIESNPMNVPRTLFSALDAVCFNAMVRHGDRNVRRVMSVVEILELDADGDLVTNPVFKWDAKNDKFIFTGKSHIFEKIETQLGVSEHELVNEMQARGKFLRSLRENNIRDYSAVVEKIHEYTLNHS